MVLAKPGSLRQRRVCEQAREPNIRDLVWVPNSPVGGTKKRIFVFKKIEFDIERQCYFKKLLHLFHILGLYGHIYRAAEGKVVRCHVRYFSSIEGGSSIIFVKNAKNLFQLMLVKFRGLLGSVVVNGRDLNFVDQGTGP